MDYSEERASAYEDIKEAGSPLTLKRSVGGEYDPTSCRTAPPTVFEYPCYAVTEEYDTKAIDGTLILEGDKKLLVTAAADFPEPQAADTLEAGATVYKVVRCKPLAPGGVAILYEVQARI